jgi:adenylate cyclase class 2
MIEEEVKLPFENVEAALRAVHAAGGRLVVSRRRLADALYDTADDWLRRAHQALRLRRDGETAYLTYKGPPRPGPVKSREEIEFQVSDADAGHALLTALGFRPVFQSEKFREEYALGATRVAVDETPMGVFVEIEGAAADIEPAANRLGRSREDYVLESYPALYEAWRRGQEA